jgi:hypothetical protein
LQHHDDLTHGVTVDAKGLTTCGGVLSIHLPTKSER